MKKSSYLVVSLVFLFTVAVLPLAQAAGAYPGYDCSTLIKDNTAYVCQTGSRSCTCDDASTTSYKNQGPHGECDGEVYDPGSDGTTRGYRGRIEICDCHSATGIDIHGFFRCNLTQAKCAAGELMNLTYCGCFSADRCTISTTTATVTEVSNTGSPGARQTQVFSISGTFIPGDILSATVYSHPVFVTAAAGDTPSSMAIKLAAAVNATTSAQWQDHSIYPYYESAGEYCWEYSTPYFVGQLGYKPSASSMGPNVTLILNYQNQFGVAFSRTSPACP